MTRRFFFLSFAAKVVSHKDSKAQRKMRSIFLLRAFVPSWQISFFSEADKRSFLSFSKSLFVFTYITTLLAVNTAGDYVYIVDPWGTQVTVLLS